MSWANQVFQNRFAIAGTQHEFEVIRLWEQPVEAFLQKPGLLPFAPLAWLDQQNNEMAQK